MLVSTFTRWEPNMPASRLPLDAQLLTTATPLHVPMAVLGAGIAGLVTALQLLDRGHAVALFDGCSEAELGGQAWWAFGGMALVGTPLQRRSRIPDSAELAWADWQSCAQFGEDDHWPRAWAQHYIERCVPDVYEYLTGKGATGAGAGLGLRYLPAVQWPERGLMRPGNSVPRYHVLWGCSRAMVQAVLARLLPHRLSGRLQVFCGHRVLRLASVDGRIIGFEGVRQAAQAAGVGHGEPFEVHADVVVVATGGITGDLNRVRQHWPADLGKPPAVLLNGSHPSSDGAVHDEVARVGGSVTHLDQMWNYAAGVDYPQPHFAGHGLSLIPTRSALWLDPRGRRIGPVPLVTGFDTRAMVQQIAQAGWPHTWQVLNRKIALKELAASGAEHNPLIRDRQVLGFLKATLLGNHALVDELLGQCRDFVQAPDLPTLAQRMNALVQQDQQSATAVYPSGDYTVRAEQLAAEIAPYDAQIAAGPKFHNDDQLRRIAHLRHWTGDRVRTCKFQRILDDSAGPLIAIRCRLLTRKSMGGIQTDLQSRVLSTAGEPIPGLYAVGEAAGFGGGGINGTGSLEGTFLSSCLLTAQAAANSLGRA